MEPEAFPSETVATLAGVVVAHQAMNGGGEPLIDSVFVNATLVLVVAARIAGPILTAHYGKRTRIQATAAPLQRTA
jgi:hypothetical protein